MILTWDIIRRTLEVLWIINVIFAVWTVFRSRRSVVATWAWMLVLTILPGIGFILYLQKERARRVTKVNCGQSISHTPNKTIIMYFTFNILF